MKKERRNYCFSSNNDERENLFDPMKVHRSGVAIHGSLAFTLLEVMLAMAMLVLLTGGLFALVQGTVQGTAEIHQGRTREREFVAFTELCERSLRSLPANASFETKFQEKDEPYLMEIIFREAPSAFSLGGAPSFPFIRILSVRPQVGGRVNISLSYKDEKKESSLGFSPSGKRNRNIVLLADLRKVEWRFFDPRNGTWMEGWKDTVFRPSMVELSITPAEDKVPFRTVFWLPPVVKMADAR